MSTPGAERRGGEERLREFVEQVEDAFPNEPHEDCLTQWAGAYDCYEAGSENPCGPCQIHHALDRFLAPPSQTKASS